MNPEDTADQVDGIVTTLLEDATVESTLTPDEWCELHDTLDQILAERITYATVMCLKNNTKKFLLGYTEGVPNMQTIHALVANVA